MKTLNMLINKIVKGLFGPQANWHSIAVFFIAKLSSKETRCAQTAIENDPWLRFDWEKVYWA